MNRPRASISRPLLAGLTSLLAATALLAVRPGPVDAAVTREHGYRATVLGFTSWYGSYGMGSLGTAWCIDHGIRSPDPAYAYGRADVAEASQDTRTALSWAVGRWGTGEADRTTHAALMLALHDLMGATYPYGRLDVDRLTTAGLAGFNGQEAAVLARARTIKADALGHRSLRGTLRLAVSAGPPAPDGRTTVQVSLRDDAGRGAAGIGLLLDGRDAGWPAPVAVTDRHGRVIVTARPTSASARFRVRTTVPRLSLDAWRSSTTVAQRIVRPAVVPLVVEAALAPPPTTSSTTTTTTTTSTTIPPAPSTTTTTSTTIALPPSTTSTNEAPPPTGAGGPPTTSPPPSPPPAPRPPSPPAAPSLPRTGIDALTGALYGVGLVLIGLALMGPRQPSAPPARRSAMRASS